jgi:hypothetical protein
MEFPISSLSERSHLSPLSFSPLPEARRGLADGRRRNHYRGDLARGELLAPDVCTGRGALTLGAVTSLTPRSQQRSGTRTAYRLRAAMRPPSSPAPSSSACLLTISNEFPGMIPHRWRLGLQRPPDHRCSLV